jgi:hypothetical protein
MPEQIRIPYNFVEREYQLPLMKAICSKKFDRAVAVWNRRSGKDKTCLNIMMVRAMKEVGSYFYLFPTYEQGRKIMWDGIDRDGFRFMDHIPKAVRKKTDNAHMSIDLANGSNFRIVGTDDVDSLVGTNPLGCVFSEYPLQDPKAWDFIRPILAENKGWAIFAYTPRGKNHGWDIYDMAKHDHHWFCERLTANDTKCIPEEVLKKEREEIVAIHGDDALYQQEYMCSFEVPMQGAYYALQLQTAYDEARITRVPYDPRLPVNTYWDLGMSDTTAIWFVQFVGKEIHFIDCLEASGESLQYYIRELKQKPYVYRDHYAPHDIEVRELNTGMSRRQTARNLGIQFRIAPKLSIDDGIQAVRTVLNMCYFDEVKCKRGLDALKQYHKEFDDKNRTYKPHPKHDWSSNFADSLRYFAVSYRESNSREIPIEEHGRKQTRRQSIVNKLTGW